MTLTQSKLLRIRQDFGVHFGYACGLAIGAVGGAHFGVGPIAIVAGVVFVGSSIAYCVRYYRLITKDVQA